MKHLNLEKESYTFQDVLAIMKILRGENGCPWDREQTHESLKPSTLEEVYEVIDAINKKDHNNLKEELGDMLLHVIFHAQIAEDLGTFTVENVISELAKKLIRRHPHVFLEQETITSEQVNQRWNAIKKKEKKAITQTELMKSIPNAMPALIRAAKIQKKAAEVGLDFHTVEDALRKVQEELKELEIARKNGDSDDIMEEYGDVLFSIVNISRFLKINPEISLTNALEKFINRFEGIEKIANQRGFKLESMTLKELNLLWDEVKI